MKKSFIKRLPLKRGKGKFKSQKKPVIIKLEYLNLLQANANVDLNLLIKSNIVKEKDARENGVKILGNGEIKKKLNVYVATSNSAAKKIEKVGGKVISQSKK